MFHCIVSLLPAPATSFQTCSEEEEEEEEGLSPLPLLLLLLLLGPPSTPRSLQTGYRARTMVGSFLKPLPLNYYGRIFSSSYALNPRRTALSLTPYLSLDPLFLSPFSLSLCTCICKFSHCIYMYITRYALSCSNACSPAGLSSSDSV